MKKVLSLFLSIGLMFACTDVKQSKEYKELEAERDSLMMHSSSSDSELTDMLAVINSVEENFDKIREAENYLAVQSSSAGELNRDTKNRINDNFQMINDILKKNKQQLAALNKKFKNSSGQVVALKNTVERLNKEMENRATRIAELQSQLANRDETISQLSTDLNKISEHAEEQSETIKEQDEVLHTAYYVFGTARELKEQKILSGGFLSSTKVMKDTFNKDYFLKIDIRDVTQIPLYAPKAKLWSNHPQGTYVFEEGEDKNLTLKITDTQRFWSLAKYLIIEVH